MEFKEHKAYKYALDIVDRKIPSNKDIYLTCQKFLKDYDEFERGESDYIFDLNTAEMIDSVVGLINMASGVSAGTSAREALGGFQWFFIMNALCWKEKDRIEKRRYEKSVLLIGRKSGRLPR